MQAGWRGMLKLIYAFWVSQWQVDRQGCTGRQHFNLKEGGSMAVEPHA